MTDIKSGEQALSIINTIKKGGLEAIQELCNNDRAWLWTLLDDNKGHQLLIIHYAAVYGQLSLITWLIETEQGLLDEPDQYNRAPLCFAAAHGHLPVVMYLVRKKAAVDRPVNDPTSYCDGYLPLHWAIKYKKYNVVLYLMRLSPHNTKDFHAIHYAAMIGDLAIVELFLNDNPKLLDITTQRGYTPLLFAAANGYLHLVSFFVTRGADPLGAKGPDGYLPGCNPIEWAREQNHSTVVDYLEEAVHTQQHNEAINCKKIVTSSHSIFPASTALEETQQTATISSATASQGGLFTPAANSSLSTEVSANVDLLNATY